VTDPEYVAKLVKATKITDPKRVEIRFKDPADLIKAYSRSPDISRIIVEARDLPVHVQVKPSKILEDENPEVRDLIDWLRRYRIENGISLETLAQQIGISKGSLMAYLDGKRLPSQTRLGRIEKFKESVEVQKP
jgi:DNA-binding XRE family transcriptional regulator